MPRHERDPSQASELRLLLTLASLDVVRAQKNDVQPDIDQLVAQIVDAAESPEDAVLACLQFSGAAYHGLIKQAGLDVEAFLQSIFTLPPEEDRRTDESRDLEEEL